MRTRGQRDTVPVTSEAAGLAASGAPPLPVSPYAPPLRVLQLYARVSPATAEKARGDDAAEDEEDEHDGSAHRRSQDSDLRKLH